MKVLIFKCSSTWVMFAYPDESIYTIHGGNIMNTRKQRLLGIVAMLCLAGLSAPANSEDMRGASSPVPFTSFDRNGDSVITEDEFNQTRAERIQKRMEDGRRMRGMANTAAFADIDTDHDGQISPKEFEEHQIQHRRQMQKQMP